MNGEKSSMPMLPAYLTVDSLPEESKDVIVMDAGGTNLRVALLRINPGQKPELLWHHKQPVPGKPGPMTPEAFFDALAQAVGVDMKVLRNRRHYTFQRHKDEHKNGQQYEWYTYTIRPERKDEIIRIKARKRMETERRAAE